MQQVVDNWEQALAEIQDRGGHLLNVLNLIQEKEGFLKREELSRLAQKEGMSEAQIYGLVTFFNAFRLKPCGKHRLSICYGTACYVKGAPQIFDRLADELKVDRHGNSPDGLVTLETVYCVGACSRAPVVVANGELRGKLNISQALSLLQELKNK